MSSRSCAGDPNRSLWTALFGTLAFLWLVETVRLLWGSGYRAGFIAGGVFANIVLYISPFVAVLFATGLPRALAAVSVLCLLVLHTWSCSNRGRLCPNRKRSHCSARLTAVRRHTSAGRGSARLRPIAFDDRGALAGWCPVAGYVLSPRRSEKGFDVNPYLGVRHRQVPGVWSANLPLPDYGRLARHSGVTVTVSLGDLCDHPLLHHAARMDASDWNHWSGICVSASVSKVSRFRLGSGEDS